MASLEHPKPKNATDLPKFNSVMADAPARTVLKAKKDPARQMQIAIGVVIALAALIVSAYITYDRNKFDPFEGDKEQSGRPTQYGPGGTRQIQE